MVGNFSPLALDKRTQMRWTSKSFSFKNMRNICQAKLMGKHLVAACDNGCIEVYDPDSMECLYGFGLVKFGPIRDLEWNAASSSILGLGPDGEVYQASFLKISE